MRKYPTRFHRDASAIEEWTMIIILTVIGIIAIVLGLHKFGVI